LINYILQIYENGLLAMNVGDTCSDRGFEKLVHDANAVFQRQGNAGSAWLQSQKMYDQSWAQ